MQQLMEFAGNHPVLVLAFVAILAALVVTELRNRGQGYRRLSASEAVSYINRDGARVIDVSPAADFNKGHILGATQVPMSRIKDPDPKLKKLFSRPLLVTCKTGQTAGQAAAALVKAGAADVAVLKGGMAQWASDNYPVTRG